MKAENKRIMITIPPDLEAEIQSLKKRKFFMTNPMPNVQANYSYWLECVQKSKTS